jgi:hypothetical protein
MLLPVLRNPAVSRDSQPWRSATGAAAWHKGVSATAATGADEGASAGVLVGSAGALGAGCATLAGACESVVGVFFRKNENI